MIVSKFYALLFFVCFFSLHISAQVNTSKPFLQLSGEVLKSQRLTIDDLTKMKHVSVSMKDRKGETHNYGGVAIHEILRQAGVTMGKDLKGENLAKYLLAKCADGYQVIFSLAEIDSSFTDRVVMLAYESDNKPLPAGIGPFRMVVPDDKKPARSSYQVNELVVRFAKE